MELHVLTNTYQNYGYREVHAGVRCAMNQRSKQERLCRYNTRRAIADERLANRWASGVNAENTLSGWHDPHRSLLEFMQRLTALVPWLRLNLTRFYGVLAPNAKLRAEIIPGSKKNKSNASDRNDAAPHSSATVRISWARLLTGVFEIDIEHCPHCGGNMKIIAIILERAAITKIPNHLGLLARAPPRSDVFVIVQQPICLNIRFAYYEL